MKKTLATILCLALAMSLLGVVPAMAEEAAPKAEAYIMYANSDWSVSYFNNGDESVIVPANAEVNDYGVYTVGLDFSAVEGGVDLAFTAVGVKAPSKTSPAPRSRSTRSA